jgi:hypothetical protein
MGGNPPVGEVGWRTGAHRRSEPTVEKEDEFVGSLLPLTRTHWDHEPEIKIRIKIKLKAAAKALLLILLVISAPGSWGEDAYHHYDALRARGLFPVPLGGDGPGASLANSGRFPKL